MITGALCVMAGFGLCAVCVGVCAETLADAVVETVYRKVERWPVADALDEKEDEL